MPLHAVLDLVACVGHLALGVLVLSRQTDSPLALLLGLLTLNLFSWTFADFGYTLSGAIQWHWLDLGLSPFTGPLAFHLVTAFVGGVRRYRWPLIAAYVFFAALAASAWLAFAFPWARAWLGPMKYSLPVSLMVALAPPVPPGPALPAVG